MSDIIANELKADIKKKLNCVVVITGRPGMGKSWAALRLACVIDKTFTLDKVAFTAKELSYIINVLDPRTGECIIADEAAVMFDNRLHYSMDNIMMTHLLNVIRRRGCILFLTAPASSHIDKKILEISTHIAIIEEKQASQGRSMGQFKKLDHNTILKKTYKKNLQGFFDSNTGKVKYPKHYFWKPPGDIGARYDAVAEAAKSLMEKAVDDHFRNKSEDGSDLTDNQREILQAKAEGLRPQEIAKKLGKTDNTINVTLAKLRKRGLVPP